MKAYIFAHCQQPASFSAALMFVNIGAVYNCPHLHEPTEVYECTGKQQCITHSVTMAKDLDFDTFLVV